MFKDGTSLFERNAGKQLDELPDRNPVFEVLEEGGDRHACAAEQPGSANALNVALHSVAS